MSDTTMVTVTDDHLKLASRLRFDWDDEIEWGCIATDAKRPFGNSDVPGDVSEILGREVSHEEARRLTIELAAIVSAAFKLGMEHAATGGSIPLPWRASRALR